ncbi:hypothetical protein OGAPHI_000099 [Ogataea philodendri]|uniref:Uncharacterized protein n=1 Tax=Ogataea philodendri TaxID=1378263 RepID=A0A9P8TA06_9ASCO|nr:uncharacterized protein OGAPHI_000099 [Ogataea philodendri]KAH3671913.1 hypothetical protein OGAPHI_000099 [Ogataea philodendri]
MSVRFVRPFSVGIRSLKQRYPLIDTLRAETRAHPIYIVCLPITTRKLFFFCQYTDLALPDGKESLDAKATKWATRAWNKLEQSQNRVNKAVVDLVQRLLKEIPWTETCFRSIPSQSKITRYLKKYQETEKEHELEKPQDRKLHPKQLAQLDISAEDLEQIPLYYPSTLLSSETIHNELRNEITKGAEYHRKYMFLNLVLLPLTLPFALIPVVPNVPGFYMAYRAYCHFTALNGVKHLRYLLDPQGGENHHLEMIGLETAHNLFLDAKHVVVRTNVLDHIEKSSDMEKLLLDEGSIKTICEAFGIEEFEQNFHVALYQERKRLAQEGLEQKDL